MRTLTPFWCRPEPVRELRVRQSDIDDTTCHHRIDRSLTPAGPVVSEGQGFDRDPRREEAYSVGSRDDFGSAGDRCEYIDCSGVGSLHTRESRLFCTEMQV